MSPGKSAVIDAADPAKLKSISPADPCTIVIFGASGDLSRRKLVPALYGLAAQNCLARRFAIIGFARTPMTDEAFQKSAVDSVKKFADANTLREEECKEFANALAYVAGEYHHPDAFVKLKSRLEELDHAHNLNGNRLFYLSTPPEIYPVIIEQLDKAGLAKHPNGSKISWCCDSATVFSSHCGTVTTLTTCKLPPVKLWVSSSVRRSTRPRVQRAT